jgi:hypothetical protein
MVQEAVDGTQDLRKSVDRIQKLYAQEADRFDLPEDYVQQKVISDLLDTLDDYIHSSMDQIKDPRALMLLRKITNPQPDAQADQLDQFARLPNPKEQK